MPLRVNKFWNKPNLTRLFWSLIRYDGWYCFIIWATIHSKKSPNQSVPKAYADLNIPCILRNYNEVFTIIYRKAQIKNKLKNKWSSTFSMNV